MALHSRRRRILALVFVAPLVLAAGLELGLRATRSGLDAYRLWPPGLSAVLQPEAGLLPGVQGPARFSIGPEGFRAGPIPAGCEVAILALGGSTTECLYLDTDEAWPARLEVRLAREDGPTVWVANGGRSGRNLRDHVVQLAHLLPQHPELDLVVLLVGVNDLTLRLSLDEEWEALGPGDPAALEALLPRAFSRLPLGREPGAPWKRTALWRTLQDLHLRWFGWRRDRAAITGEVYARWRSKRTGAGAWRAEAPDLNAALDDFRGLLGRAADLCAAAGVRLVPVTQPTVWSADLTPEVEARLWLGGVGDFQEDSGGDYYTAGALATAMAAFNAVLLEVANERGLDALDLATALGRDPSLYYDDCHFNELGAERVARLVAEHLRTIPPLAPR